MHPLYHRAKGMVGQPVIVHAYGRVHRGVLHSLTTDGIYVRSTAGAGMASHDTTGLSQLDTLQAPATDRESIDVEHVFWPLLFLPFFAIAALGPWWWW